MSLFKRPIVFLDFEATGTDPFVDRAVSLALIRYEPGVKGQTWYDLFNPECPIPPETTDVHGITDEMVKDKLTFKSRAREILPWFEDADLGGYNILKYDLPMLVTEFERAGFKFPWRDRLVIDPSNIFRKKYPRDLTAALKEFCGEEMEGAHNALADTAATARIFAGQLQKFDDLRAMTMEELHKFSEMEPCVDLARKIGVNKDGEPIFNFGKSRGKRVLDDVGFANWMLRSDFPQDTKECLGKILRAGPPSPQRSLL